MRRHPSRTAGFTLLELMILLAIIGVTAAIVVPSIATRSRPFDMAESSRRLNSEIVKILAQPDVRVHVFAEMSDFGCPLHRSVL